MKIVTRRMLSLPPFPSLLSPLLSVVLEIGVPQDAAYLFRLLLGIRARFQHFDEEIVDRYVADQLEEEEMLQALEPNRADRR